MADEGTYAVVSMSHKIDGVCFNKLFPVLTSLSVSEKVQFGPEVKRP